MPAPVNRRWGSVARNGARVLTETDQTSASSAWQSAVARARAVDASPAPSPGQVEVWVRDDDSEPERPRQVAGGRGRARLRHTVPFPVTQELYGEAGSRRGPKLAERLAEATHAYDRDRYTDALNILRPLAQAAPRSAAVRELYGLTLYRMGRWRAALKELEAYFDLSGAYDQHPVRMDCDRALRSYREIDRLWEELRQASPSGEVVAEGRIVVAGALADRGDLSGAIQLLERSATVSKPREHHLRQWYALADLHERAGDVTRARDLFKRIAAADPDTFDTADRLRALR